MKELTLSDGRTLAYDTYGDLDGTPVIFNHGFSDSRLVRNPDEALTASLGVWVIAADQPGVGGSSPQPNRRMVDWGFNLSDIAQPFDVFYGDADDIVEPAMPMLVAEQLPNGTSQVWEGAGHYGFVDRERWKQFLGAVAV